MITRSFRTCFAAAVVAVVGVAYAAIEIRSDYPGGNVKVDKIDEAANVVVLRPDLRDTKGNWFYWDFTLSGAAGRRLHFQFPKNGYDYLASLGPAISRDGGKTWRWLNEDGKRHEPKNAFDYTFAADETETRFATSIPYLQKDWDAASVRWRGKDGVKFDVLCKSQSGRRDTELLRIPCRKGKAKWLFAYTARHHACETTANPVMEGIIDEILSGSPEGEWVRDNAGWRPGEEPASARPQPRLRCGHLYVRAGVQGAACTRIAREEDRVLRPSFSAREKLSTLSRAGLRVHVRVVEPMAQRAHQRIPPQLG